MKIVAKILKFVGANPSGTRMTSKSRSGYDASAIADANSNNRLNARASKI